MTATKKKSSTAKKRTAAKSSPGRKTASRKKKTSKAAQANSRGLSLEILILTVMAVSVLLFIRPVAAVLGVELHHRMGGGSRAREEVENNIVCIRHLGN